MIDISDLKFAYSDAQNATLNGVSFSIGRGEVFGLLGPSGAGKSTTQKILMGLLSGYTGQVNLFDSPIKKLGRDLYERIGVSFEMPALYLRLTALENLKLFSTFYEHPISDPLALLRSVDLEEAAHQRVDSFSKGMKMRLNLCRALIHDPELIFLDEPTTGQDPARARITRELILDLKARGKTIFLTTHNMAEASEVCDRVAFLVEGCIPVMGAPHELMREFGKPVLEVAVQASDGLEKVQFPMHNIHENTAFKKLLATGTISSMHTLEASLDDVFIHATHRQNGISSDVDGTS